MTPERRRRIHELFGAALRIDPGERDGWLDAACAGDDALRDEVRRLLEQDISEVWEEFLTSPEPAGRSADQTESWFPYGEALVPQWRDPAESSSSRPATDVSGFSPRPVIAPGSRLRPVSEAESVIRARLRELPVIHILILAMASFWRCRIVGDRDCLLFYLDVSVGAVLGVLLALFWSWRRASLGWLQTLELGMIGMLATRLAIVEYRLVLNYSVQGDIPMAQFIVKNIALIIAILIPSYGLYVPKHWWRAALGVGPLALLPFATLLLLNLWHPHALGWLWQGRGTSALPRFLLFSFDALILLVLAAASTFGARAISILRRQIAEARQLGQYRLRRQIGEGGMGEVYLAEHQLLKRPCALKLIRPESMTDPKALARFEREVRLTAALSHPNTVEIYDYGRTDKGTYYYVMEYLPGLSLAELVEQHGPLPPGRVVYLLRQVCHALSEAHDAGLIHRDIKPSNVLVSRRGGMDDVAKLLDFGLVLPLATLGGSQLSGEGQVFGTPLFMSPEQATGGDIDGRSDLYSLGAVAYYLLTGRPPFEGDDGIQLMVAHARDPVVPPSLLCEQVPADLERVVLRGLAKDPASRFPNAGTMELALARCACAADWDQNRAAPWWRAADRERGSV